MPVLEDSGDIAVEELENSMNGSNTIVLIITNSRLKNINNSLTVSRNPTIVEYSCLSL